MVNITNNPRRYSWHDQLIMRLTQCIRTINNLPQNKNIDARPNPADTAQEATLTAKEKRHSAALMRVNHTGEVCAQALYLGQSITARSNTLRDALSTAAKEESDHLHWCEQRIHQLDSHTSYLNPLWFTGSLLIGTVAGLIGDKWSLGFLAQTEQQVFDHLSHHLNILPAHDHQSLKIVAVMQEEEAMHAKTAVEYGAADLPFPVTWAMRIMAKMMTSVTYYV